MIKKTKRKHVNNGSSVQRKRRRKEDSEQKSDSYEEIPPSFIQEQRELEKEKSVEEEEEDPYKNETADEKKVRLAKMYLEQLATMEGENDQEREEEDPDRLGNILQEEAFEAKYGRKFGFLNIADQINSITIPPPSVRKHRAHQGSITCLAIDEDEQHFYSGDTACTIVKWYLPTLKPVHIFRRHKKDTQHTGHTKPVLSLTVSTDGTLLASGSMDNTIKVWNSKDYKLVETFSGHRDAVSGLSFRQGTHEIYSGSYDRSIKIWNCDTHAYVQTLYGHVAPITGLDCFRRERCATVSADKTTRLWKIPEQTQLVFRGSRMGIEAVALMTEDYWVTGGQDGSLSLWKIKKKKAMFSVACAHGSTGLTPNWISAVGVVPYSDLVATGSNNNVIKLWKLVDAKEFIHLKDIPLIGWINSLKFSKTGKFLIAGVGRDHRMGRWWTNRQAKSGVCIIPLLPEKQEDF